MYAFVGVGLLSLLLGAGGAWKIQDWRYGAKEADRLQLVKEDRQFREKTIDVAGTKYENKRANIETKYVTITQTVDKFIDRPVYKNICLDDDGIKAVNDAIDTITEVKP